MYNHFELSPPVTLQLIGNSHVSILESQYARFIPFIAHVHQLTSKRETVEVVLVFFVRLTAFSRLLPHGWKSSVTKVEERLMCVQQDEQQFRQILSIIERRNMVIIILK